ncbi:SRPBCC domain-containing protein [Chitinimonas sp.]|uniref:SRPBCC family protein n=1 Tax=Chitinimonas sp. TaxID=1934313 RepID=UPI002F927537
MSHYQQSLVIEASPAAVYAALATPTGLKGWWTEDCEGASQTGGSLQFRFGDTHKTMRIERLEPGRLVHWRCTQAHVAIAELSRKDEWVGTELAFQLSDLGAGRTRLDFSHYGLTPALECYELCNRGWQHFLGSLQQYAQTGKGTPYEMAEEGAKCVH